MYSLETGAFQDTFLMTLAKSVIKLNQCIIEKLNQCIIEQSFIWPDWDSIVPVHWQLFPKFFLNWIQNRKRKSCQTFCYLAFEARTSNFHAYYIWAVWGLSLTPFTSLHVEVSGDVQNWHNDGWNVDTSPFIQALILQVCSKGLGFNTLLAMLTSPCWSYWLQ